MSLKDYEDRRPDWARRAAHQDSRPVWQDKIPETLYELGEVFFPIPPGRKGWDYPHHMQSKRYSADSEVLNGYFAQGWGYGISCAGSIAVVDIDEPDMIPELTSILPETAYQWSGSREGVHLFYFVPGLDKRQNLSIHLRTFDATAAEGYDMRDDQSTHIGEVKCDPHGYVIGPGSLHPSGNHYGPIHGESITEVDKEHFLSMLKPYIYDSSNNSWDKAGDDWSEFYDDEGYSDHPDYDLYSLSADDVLPWLEPNKRIEHPVHGSETGMNFMKNDDRETFTCWRCTYGIGQGCGLNAQQILALMERGTMMGDNCCERVRRNWTSDSRLHYYAWKRALEDGLIAGVPVPYRVAKGYAVHHGVIDESDELAGDAYHDIMTSMEWQAEKNREVVHG